MKLLNVNIMNDFYIQMLLRLMISFPDSKISLTALTFPSSRAWERVDSIEKNKYIMLLS